MARINIEDTLFKDGRFIDLCIAAGSRITALGALSWLWIEAQKHYLKIGFIPNQDWINAGLPEYLITTNWAERIEHGVKAWGQEEQFGWLRAKSESGKSSSQAKLDALQKAREKRWSTENQNDSSENSERTLNESEPPSLSPPLTLSSFSDSEKALSSGNDESHGWRSLLRIYNENRGPLPFAKQWNKDRERFAQQRWKELPDETQWIKVVKYFASSPHHIGQNDRGWIASFDFILQKGRWLQAQERFGVAVEAKPSNRVDQNKAALDAFKRNYGGQK